MGRKALVTGVNGQDGAYLCKLLLEKGYTVYGFYRRSSSPNFWRLQHLGVFDQVQLIPGDMTDSSSLLEAITISEPEEVYNLAAQSFVGASFDSPLVTTNVDGLGTARILEAIRILNPKIKFYQASTSEIFGNVEPDQLPIHENTPKNPSSPYAAAKLYSYHLCKIYREAYGLFASNGILFNHESPLRGLEFITRKISNMVSRIALGLEEKLHLGNLDAKRDWGYAPEYVEAMWMMMQQEQPGDLVIATGETHSVREWVQISFACAGIENWQDYVSVDKRFLRPVDINILLGDPSNAAQVLEWTPRIKFRELVELMLKEDRDRWSRHTKGEIFAWDAPNFPGEKSVLTRTLRI